MAKIKDKGMFKFAGTYEVTAANALDPRVQWDSYEDLIKKEYWPTNGDTVYVYNGLIAAVGDEVWMLIDKDKFIEKVHNSVGILNSVAKVVTKEDGSREVVYKTKDVAELLGWKIIGATSEVEDHCLKME
jgi:hypothetical protein